LFEFVEDPQALRRRGGGKDPVPVGIGVGQVSPDGAEHVRVVVDGEHGWTALRRHGGLLSALNPASVLWTEHSLVVYLT
jgi:hypothetical protein